MTIVVDLGLKANKTNKICGSEYDFHIDAERMKLIFVMRRSRQLSNYMYDNFLLLLLFLFFLFMMGEEEKECHYMRTIIGPPAKHH